MRSLSKYGDPIPGCVVEEERDIYRIKAEKIIEWLLGIQNRDGSWGAGDDFKKIYHTTQVLQALFHSGFPLNNDHIRKAFGFLDKYLHPHVDNRAVYFLYAALDKLTENDLRTYIIQILKRKQNEDGSFLFFTQKSIPDDAAEDHWVRNPQLHRGASIFHTLHIVHFLSMIDTERYSSVKNSIEEIIERSLDFLTHAENEMHILPDKNGNLDPEFTTWWLERLYMLGKLPDDFENTIRWILEKQEDGLWKATVVSGIDTKQATVLPTCYTIFKLCSLPLQGHLLDEVKSAVNNALDRLIENEELWKKDENKSAVVARTLVNGSNFIQPNVKPHIYNRSMYSNIKILFDYGKRTEAFKKRIRLLHMICLVLSFLVILLALNTLMSFSLANLVASISSITAAISLYQFFRDLRKRDSEIPEEETR